MSLDAELVRDAEAARERLIQAQHAAERARADYHLAIRRLHAAGGSLREIAEVLRLSHQRVHQIVDQAAEPPRRWWRLRGPRRKPPGPCSFCGRSHEQVARLIAGPGVFICERCVAHAGQLAAGAAAGGRAEAPMRVEPSASGARCSFCGKPAQQVRCLVASGVAEAPAGRAGEAGAQASKGARICDECLTVCEEIQAEAASP